MNPVQPTALDTLLEREEADRVAVLAHLREVRAQAEHARLQADQLRQYRAEYADRWTRQFRQGGTMALVQCYQTFMQRLEQAVQQQAQLAEHAQTRVDGCIEAVRAAELRVASVRKLIERRRQQTQREAERAQQRQTDEAAQRTHARRRAEQPTTPTDTSWMM